MPLSSSVGAVLSRRAAKDIHMWGSIIAFIGIIIKRMIRHGLLKDERRTTMPVIARFYGMVVKMFFIQSEHNPPHFHVVYGEYLGAINIQTGQMIEGDLPVKALSIAQEWLQLHKTDLLDIWDTQTFRKLPPLV